MLTNSRQRLFKRIYLEAVLSHLRIELAHDFKQRANMRPRSRGAMRPRFASVFAHLKKRGRGESRAPIAPAVVHKKRTSRPQGNRIIRLSPHDGLRLIRDHPGDRAFLPPSPCGLTMDRKPGWARHISTGLDASVGASGPHDFAVRACPAKALAGPRPYPASFVEDSFQRRSSARRTIAHGVQSALRSLARPTLSRPSHPAARS